MPELGEIREAREIGYKGGSKYIYHACIDCGKCRWVQFRVRKEQPQNLRCSPCARKLGGYSHGEKHPSWKGGRIKRDGYILIRLYPNDFFYPMTGKAGTYVPEHRLVMAKKLGRCLASWEIVHHKGIRYISIENKSDNLEDNLEMTTSGSHAIEHSKGYHDGYAKGFQDGRLKQIKELKEEIKLLREERWK